jgi:hypothetical protein
MLRRIVLTVLLTTWFFPPAARAETPVSQQQRPARQAVTAPPSALGTEAEAQRLAQREQQAQSLRDFEGGRGGIGTTTLIIILLLIIIIIIIL